MDQPTRRPQPGSRKENWTGMNWIRQEKRLAIYLRDGLSCGYCGTSLEEGAQLTLDHVNPHSHGGSNHPANLITCCARCNASRGDRPMTDFAVAVAAYLNHGVTAAEIITHVHNARRRKLPTKEAQDLIDRRGSAAKALAFMKPRK